MAARCIEFSGQKAAEKERPRKKKGVCVSQAAVSFFAAVCLLLSSSYGIADSQYTSCSLSTASVGTHPPCPLFLSLSLPRLANLDSTPLTSLSDACTCSLLSLLLDFFQLKLRSFISRRSDSSS